VIFGEQLISLRKLKPRLYSKLPSNIHTQLLPLLTCHSCLCLVRFMLHLDSCALGVDHNSWSGWQQPALLGEQMGKHLFGSLPLYEAFMDVEQQLLDQRLGLLTTRFPDGFDGDAPIYR
jgi:hypothetical protein